ncbi:putative oxidoreductase [Pseudomonas syringae pv. helianthi]|uniref:Putative oxidoreductase n=1 Tax=Pseudomonas syringae pv. helianthi TaxID=251654 RepID=A0A0P9S9T6_9PSED|nr:putative oxidoreductase [Pseudomonas syringae pv. helianthi]RMR09353.1 putative oxidoreductase [Pseudomonas syringae pv. helianthi]
MSESLFAALQQLLGDSQVQQGTLGIITAATLKLFPLPKARAIAFLAFDRLADAVSFLSHARAGLGAGLTAFELLSAECLALLREQFAQGEQPFRNAPQPWFALLELSDNHGEEHARATFEAVLGDALEQGCKLTAKQLEQHIGERTRWLILNGPGNPSGAVYDREELMALAEVLRRHPNVLILLDELYEHIRFDGHAALNLLNVAADLTPRCCWWVVCRKPMP